MNPSRRAVMRRGVLTSFGTGLAQVRSLRIGWARATAPSPDSRFPRSHSRTRSVGTLLGSCHKDLPGLSSPKETHMKRWLALLGCALAVTACSDHSQPTGPNPRLGLLDGSSGGQIGQIPPLSGVVAVVPNFAEPDVPGLFDAPSLSAPNVGTNVAMNQDRGFFPQNETPIAVDPNDPQRLFSGANDYRSGIDAACGVYGSRDGGATWNAVGT